MADIKILKANGVEIHPVTHEDAVVNNLGLSVGFTYQPKTDNSLKTSAKTIAGGINEINSKKVINDAQNGTVDSIKIRYIKNTGARIYPLCHASKITYTNGETLQATVDALSTKNTSVTSRVSTLESTLKTIQTNNTSSNTTINTVSTAIGKLSDLQTSAKSNLVAAVNEINQFGSNLKNRLKTALENKGIIGSNTTYTINDLIAVVESEETVYDKVLVSTYTVTSVSGASYGFDYIPSTGYWTSTNKNQNSTAAVCKVTIDNPGNKTPRIYFINYAEAGFDYGIIGNKNTTLSTTNTADSNVRYSCESNNSSSEQFITLSGFGTSGWFYVKYIKDNSMSSNNDNFQFRIEFL